MKKQLSWVFESRKCVHHWWSYISFAPECKESISMPDPLLYRWGAPLVVIRCVQWTMQRGVLQTWITPSKPCHRNVGMNAAPTTVHSYWRHIGNIVNGVGDRAIPIGDLMSTLATGMVSVIVSNQRCVVRGIALSSLLSCRLLANLNSRGSPVAPTWAHLCWPGSRSVQGSIHSCVIGRPRFARRGHPKNCLGCLARSRRPSSVNESSQSAAQTSCPEPARRVSFAWVRRQRRFRRLSLTLHISDQID